MLPINSFHSGGGNKFYGENSSGFFLFAIVCIVILSYGRLFFLRNTFGDDNCWLYALYSTDNLKDFLNTGLAQLRRTTQGTFLYYLLWLHKNTDYFYLIAHSINMVTLVFTPCFLFLFVRNLLRSDLLAFFIAITSLIYPLDTTITWILNMIYPIGVMLCVISFYFTERALSKENVNWKLLSIALVMAGISYTVFIEGAVFLEPARFVTIGLIFRRRGIGHKRLIKKTLGYWLPFLLIAIPLIIYKLTFKTYGIYAGAYVMHTKFLLRWDDYAITLRQFRFQRWSSFLTELLDVKGANWFLGLGTLGAMIIAYVLNKIQNSGKTCEVDENKSSSFVFKKDLMRGTWGLIKISFPLGIVFFLPPLLVYQATGRYVGDFTESRHGAIMQVGYNFLVGSVLYFLYCVFHSIRFKHRTINFLKARTANLIIVLMVGFGVFFANWNIEWHFLCWQKQQVFWRAFTARFPSLPEKAAFLYDVKMDIPYIGNPQFNQYGFEPVLNMLYAKSARAEDFHNYIGARTVELKECNNNIEAAFEYQRKPGQGHAFNDKEELIVIYYDANENELLVNREILRKYPDVFYRNLLNRDFHPPLPKPEKYPLRYKLKGFS